MDIDIGLSQEQRDTIADGLGRLLADTYVLYGKTHGFHWNVTGPMFNTLHLMFMEQYTELWTALDEIAERIRALGLMAPHGGSTLAGFPPSRKPSNIHRPWTWCASWWPAMKRWHEQRAACSPLLMRPMINPVQTS